MIGTDPAPRAESWRRSPHTPGRLFLSFYVLLTGTFVAIALSADALISSALKGLSDDYARRYMQGTIALIEEDLSQAPQAEWESTLKGLNNRFTYPLKVEERSQLELNDEEAALLDAGKIVVQADGDIMVHRLGKSRQVLVVGPLDPDDNPKAKTRLPLELRMRLLTWSLMGLGIAVALWFWIRSLWRDLEALRQTASRLGEGDFSARSTGRFGPVFAPLAETLDGMAERIQHLMTSQRDLSSAISHELRTPIARLRFAAEMLTDTEERAERERLTASMDRDLAELDKLIDASLVYARFEREMPQPVLAPESLHDWLSEQVESLQCLAGQTTLRLADLPDAAITVPFDRKMMAYAISNLVRNALKYAVSQVQVTARVEAQDDGQALAEFCVEDDGPGIPEADREKIFGAFTRLDRARDRATGGYGLGLAIARRVLEMHGGTLAVEDGPLGGARFVARFPA